MRFKTALLPLTMPMVLAACLGGGGGSGGSSSNQSGPLTLNSTPTAFTSFDDITANSLVEASAPTSVNYRADVIAGDVQRDGDLSFEGSSIRLLTGAEIPPDVEGDDLELEFGGLRLTVNLPADETIVRDFMDNPFAVGAGAAADRYAAVEITDEADDVTDRLLLNDDDDLNYLVFGLWELGIGEASIDIGGAAWGALTPTAGDNAMPGGTASYQGDLIGYNVVGGAPGDPDTTTTIYVAQSNLGADFDANTVTFSSTGTVRLDNGAAAAGFNITATAGTISGNGFTGADPQLAVAPGTFEGSFGGNFYGPDAAEAGGWFELSNPGNGDNYFGSFGGAKVAP